MCEMTKQMQTGTFHLLRLLIEYADEKSDALKLVQTGIPANKAPAV
jgi:hypothetical protein